VTEFVVNSAVEAANKTVEEQEIIRLSQRDRTALIEALLNPPEPSPRLRRAAERYRLVFGPR
jgi:uncharacterized protein (DUF1778 family)